jgi:hypothetical protein
MFRNRFIFYGRGLLAPPPSCTTTPCRLSVAAYSMYSQLTSITGGRPSIRDPKTHHDLVTGIHQFFFIYILLFYNLLKILKE